MSYRRSIIISYVIVFSSLAIILTFIRAEVPYPLLPYLKFDFAEIPVMLVLLLCGPLPATAAATIHWIGLTIRSGYVLGPLMKYLAVSPMIVGFWLGIELYRKLVKDWGGRKLTNALAVGMLLGIVTRVIVCSITNTIVLAFIAPRYLDYAGVLLQKAGINVSSFFDVLMWTLLLTGIFNALHVPISSGVAAITLKTAALRLPVIAEKSWISLKSWQKNPKVA